MGAQVSKVRKLVRRPTASLKNVDKVLEQKTPAQRHPSTIDSYKQLIKENPEFEAIVNEKSANLHKMLETVRVNSVGAAPESVLKSGKHLRKMNVSREGKLSDKQIDELFLNRKANPDLWNVSKISEEYKLDENVAKNLLTFFSSFRIYKLPEGDPLESLPEGEKFDEMSAKYEKKQLP